MKTIVNRETKETQVRIELSTEAPAGAPAPKVDTGLPYFDHMLGTLGRYAGWELTVTARWDLKHHGMEDVAIALGRALFQVIPPTAARYADRSVVMDDALVHAAVDLGGRFYYRGKLKSRLYQHFMRSLAEHAHIALHLRVLRGRDSHHATEAAFKALGLCLRDALREGGAVFSTKGAVSWEVK